MRPAPDTGAGDTIGNRCFYRTRLIVPAEIDSDLKIQGTPFTVRLVDADLDEGWVDIKVTRSGPLGFEIEVTGSDDIVGAEGEVETKRTPCGDLLHYATWLMVGRYAFRPVVWGFENIGSVDIRWTVGGKMIPRHLSRGRLKGCQSPQGTFDVEFRRDAAMTMHLASAPGHSYHMPVEATATETATGTSVSAKTTFDPVGSFDGLPLPDQTALLRCLQRTVAVFPPDLVDLNPPPDGPRPNWQDLATHVLERSAPQAAQFRLERQALEDILALAAQT
jgi:hypothetical protein